jgi:hypothetical protein
MRNNSLANRWSIAPASMDKPEKCLNCLNCTKMPKIKDVNHLIKKLPIFRHLQANLAGFSILHLLFLTPENFRCCQHFARNNPIRAERWIFKVLKKSEIR